jgi:N-acetyl-gamma-glutamylphosphate reductase
VGTLGGLLLVAAPRQNPVAAVGLIATGTLALLRSLTNEPLVDRAERSLGAASAASSTGGGRSNDRAGVGRGKER